MSIKFCIFDFDYTLVDTSDGIVECFNYALKRTNRKTQQDLEIKKTIGLPLKDAYKLLVSDVNSENSYAEFLYWFMLRSKKIMTNYAKPCLTAKDTLIELTNRNIILSIVSSKDSNTIKRILKKFNWCNYFRGPILGEDTSEFLKPNPLAILKSIQLANEDIFTHKQIGFQECVCIGDNIVDAQAADKAHIEFFPILSGNTTSQEFDKYKFYPVKLQLLSDVLQYI